MVETFDLGIWNDAFLTQTQSLMTMGKKSLRNFNNESVFDHPVRTRALALSLTLLTRTRRA